MNILVWVFAAIWLFVLGLDYINKHPAYYYSLSYFRYTGLVVQLGIIALGIGLSRKYLPKFFSYINTGIGVFLVGVLISFLIIRSNSELVSFENNTSDHLHFTSRVVASAIQLFLIMLLCRNVGAFIFSKCFSKTYDAHFIIDIGLGIVLMVLSMFFLAMFGVLNAYSLLLVLIVFLFVNPIQFYQSIGSTLFKQLDTKQFSMAGLIILFTLLSFLLVNYISIHTPFPSGFDSRNYYVNISKLLASSGSIVQGFPPYNGSIFIATGLVLFDQSHLAHGMAFVNIVLALLAAYTFARQILKYDADTSAIIITMVGVTPAIANQMFVELKVDFGLLFFQLLALFCLLNGFKKIKKSQQPRDNFKDILKTYLPYSILLGVFIGYGLGIKMINLFLLIVIFILIGWEKDNRILSIVMVFASIAVFLFGGIDTISGLRQYHLSANYVAMAAALLAIISFAYAFIKSRILALRRVVFAGLITIFALMVFSPWAVKNYQDTKSLNPKKMLMGSSTGPEMSLAKIKKNYRNAQKNK
ncbi:MAG: hypothetical protein HKN09_09580 [Saprospiraceae bacterium]|nr:hypothetical protein [Saprospiraceae bacterium]